MNPLPPRSRACERLEDATGAYDDELLASGSIVARPGSGMRVTGAVAKSPTAGSTFARVVRAAH